MEDTLKVMGRKMTERRRYVGFRRLEIAGALGCTRDEVVEMEEGNLKPSPEQLHKLCSLYSVTVDFFLGEADPPPSDELTERVKDLEPEDRVAVLQFAAFLAWRKRSGK